MHKCNLDQHLLCKYLCVHSFLTRALICGTFFASPILQADAPSDIAQITLRLEQAAEIYSSPPQNKAKPPEIEITEHNGVYHISLLATINANARHVRHVLTDFIHIYRLNPSIIESDIIKRHDDSSVSVKTRVIGCAAYFCEELDRVERVRVLPSGDLLAEIVPELSQFKSGRTLWRISPLDEQSEVSYSANMEPDIFIPPIVGEFLIKKSIREEMQIILASLEKISNIVAEKEWQENYQPERIEFAANDPCINYAESSPNGAYEIDE
ncbi:MAG: hypothetical protein LJE83_06010 [Gammaproteobacteria bacterium]|nr:hypothetical protein [Gammaproteobacteria bacterium]